MKSFETDRETGELASRIDEGNELHRGRVRGRREVGTTNWIKILNFLLSEFKASI